MFSFWRLVTYRKEGGEVEAEEIVDVVELL
jgi:hypothetical protein